ncbi:hypothetical protein H4582DRAFT_2075293 [Lactarius indigo]|nr:hypothetical protein H4582DRAFT_2075293 [Lactarius indigo]
MTDSTPSYPALPFDNFVSQFNAVNPKHSMFSNLSALLDFNSFGHQLFLAFFTDVYMPLSRPSPTIFSGPPSVLYQPHKVVWVLSGKKMFALIAATGLH